MVIKPGILARYGTLIICGLFLLLLLLSWFIKYQDKVTATATLSGTNAPKPVMVYRPGKLLQLLKQNGSKVKAHEIIGCMETTADWRQVLTLSDAIDTLYVLLQGNNKKAIQRIMSLQFSHLGELQGDYQAFTQAYLPFKDYVLGDYANSKRTLLHNDIQYINQTKVVLDQQSSLYQEDIALNQTNLDNNKALLEDNVISAQEYRDLTSQNIGKRMSVPQMRSSYISTAAQSNDKQKELLELDNMIKTNEALFKEAVYSFKSKIDAWKHDYLLVASISGTLSFTTFIQESQVLEAGEPIAFVNPPSNGYYLQALVPQNNLGRVQVGQKVLVKFSAWQWQQYGTVIGKIDYLSSIATDSGYRARISLPNGLTTNRNKVLIYKEGLIAQAEIITKSMRLSERFYYDLIKEFKTQ